MIRVDKSKPPAEAADRCAKLTKELSLVHKALVEIYTKRPPKVPFNLTDQEKDDLILKATGKTPTSEKHRAALLKDLPPFVFKEEIVESTEPTKLPSTAQELDLLRPVWEQHLKELADRYAELRAQTRLRWTQAIDQLLATTESTRRAAIADLMARYYQRQALRSHRPFRTRKQAERPDWFEPYELRQWDAFAGFELPPPVDLAASWFGRYQQVLDTARQTVLSGTLPWLAPAVWMVTDDSVPLDPDALYAYAKGVYLSRLTNRRSLELNMTVAEMADLRELLVNREHLVAHHFLAVRAFGLVLEPAVEPKRLLTSRPLIGFQSETFDSAFYSGHGIKEALMTSHFGKCAFCEAKVRAIAHGDVEHFRPKAGYDQGHTFNYDGYFWRAYDWANLYYSCQVCNQVNKGNHFPILLDEDLQEVRQTYDRNDTQERPVLIDPGVEDPRNHIRFDPRTGRAYAFDLLNLFFLQLNVGDQQIHPGIPDVPTLIWSRPSVIPDLSRTTGDTMVTDDILHLTPEGFAALYRKVPGQQMRGTRTIQILGLNRPELVTRRVQHLRALRGLFTIAGNTPDGAEARVALEAAMRPDAEFSSLAIDAVQTWQAESKNVTAVAYPWLKRYNEILAKPPVYEYESAGFEAKDVPIMYVIEDLSTGAKSRRLVYLTAEQELDRPGLPAGWYLQVPEEDFGLTATVSTKKGTQQASTVGEIFSASQPWRKFKDTTVEVEGPFSSNLS